MRWHIRVKEKLRFIITYSKIETKNKKQVHKKNKEEKKVDTEN
jgi:hypothetical protein